MLKNIIIAVLAIIVVGTVFFAQSQGAAALEAKEQLELQLEEEQKKSEELTAVAEHTMEQMLAQQYRSDSLRQALNNCK